MKSFRRYLVIIGLLLHLSFSAFSAINQEISTYPLKVQTSLGELSIKLHLTTSFIPFMTEIAQVLKEDLPKVIDFFGYLPQGGVDIILDEKALALNGFATVFPSNLVSFNAYPALGGEYLSANPEWIRGLVLHEAAHIIHMDQTRGFLQRVRNIFGSVSKMGGVVPRWFTEGIAVYVESKFTSRGRLNDSLLEFEVMNYLVNNYRDLEIGSLDNPGKYPFGHSAYWLGAYFVKFIEDSYPGAIACLVRKNSSRVPFTLNTVFRSCTNYDALELFSLFKNRMLERVRLKNRGLLLSTEGVDLASGIVELDGELIYKKYQGKSSMLTIFNIASGRERTAELFDPIDQISMGHNSVLLKLLIPNDKNRGELDRVEWVRFLPKSMKWEKLEEQADLLFEDSLGKLAFRYLNNQFTLTRDGKRLYQFPPFSSLGKIQFRSKPGIFLLLENGEWKFFSLAKNEMLTNTPLFHGGEFEPIMFDGDRVWFKKRSGEMVEYQIQGNTLSLLALHKSVDQTSLSVNEEFSSAALVMPYEDNFFYLTKSDPRGFFPLLKSDIVPTKKLEKSSESAVSSSKSSPPSALGNRLESTFQKGEYYPSMKLMLPSYWLPMFAFGEHESYVGFSSSQSDPKRFHLLEGRYRYYTQMKEHGGNFSYTYDFEPFLYSASFTREVTYNELFDLEIYDNEWSAKVMRPIYKGKSLYAPYLVFDIEEAKHLYGKNRSTEYGVGLSYLRSATLFSDPLQLITSVGEVREYDDSYQKFSGIYWNGGLKLRLSPELVLKHSMSAERLFKSNNRSKLVDVDNQVGSRHTFIGLNGNDVWGNKIFTLNTMMDMQIASVYHGYRLWPLLTKEIFFMLGANTLYVENGYVAQRRIADRWLLGYYAGMRFTMDLFYYLPAGVEMLVTKLASPNEGGVLFRSVSEF